MFTSIDIVTVGANHKKQTVIIKVKERKKRSIRMTIGLNTERILTARGLVQLSHKNILGTGRRLFSNIKLQSNVARYAHQDMKMPKHLEHTRILNLYRAFHSRLIIQWTSECI